MVEKTVDLVLEAKNNVSKPVKDAVQSFVDLKGTLQDVTKSMSGADGGASGFVKALAQLGKEASGLQVLDKIATAMTQVSAVSSELEQNVRNTANSLATQARELADVQKRLNTYKGDMESLKVANKSAADTQSQLSKELRQAESDFRKASAAAERFAKAKDQRQSKTSYVGVDIGAAQTSARQSAAAFEAAFAEQASGRVAELTRQLAVAQTEVSDTAKEMGLLAPKIDSVAKLAKDLESEIRKQTTGLTSNKKALADSRAEMQLLEQAQSQTLSLTGRQVASQQQISAAYKATASEIERVNRLAQAAAKFSTGNGGFTDPKTAAVLQKQNEVVRQAESDWKALEAEAQRLAIELKSVSGNATEQANAFNRMAAAARAAKTEYLAQASAAKKLEEASSGIGKAAGQITAITSAAGKANAALRQTSANAAATHPPIKQMGSALEQAGAASQTAAHGTASFGSTLRALTGDTRQSLSLLQRIRGEVIALATAYIGLQGAAQQIGGVVNAFQTLEAVQARLAVAFGDSPQKVSAELRYLETQSQRLGISFETLAGEYSKFAVSAQQANFTSAATRDTFMAVAEAGRVQRLSVEQLQGIFKALGQIMDKGKVQTEELRGQLGDRMTGAFKLFADAIGVTTAQLDDMLKKGEVIANQDTLGKFGQRLRQIYGPQLGASLESTTAQIGKLQDTLFKTQILVGQGGFVDAFTKGVKRLNEALSSREGRDFFISLGAALTKVTNGLVAALPYFDDLAAVLGILFVRYKVLPFFTNMVSGLASTATGVANTTAAMFTWQGTIAAVQTQWNALTAYLKVGTGALTRLGAELGIMRALGPQVGAGFVAMRVGLTALQTVAGVTAGVFRTLWAAVGGIPGIILTGVTLAISQWFGEIGKTNTALDEHKRLMGEVLAEYDKVKGKTDEWRDAIGGVSLIELERSFRNITSELETSTKNLKSEIAGNLRGGIFNGLTFGLLRGDEQQQLDVLLESFLRGEINVKQLRRSISELNLELKDDAVKEAIGNIDDLAKQAENLGAKQEEAAIAAKALKSQSEEIGKIADSSGKSIADLAAKTDDSANAMSKNAENSAKFSASMAEIQKTTAKVSDELERLGKIDALTKLYNDGLKAAKSMGQVLALTQQYNNALGAVASGSINGNSDIVSKIIGIESGGSAVAKNPNSSATGSGQFIESTWLRMFKQYFPDLAVNMSDAQIKELRLDPQISKQMVALYAQENAKFLAGAGIKATDANLYLAHFLGPGGAKNLLSADMSAPVSSVLGSDQINANKSVLEGKNVGEVIAWAERKVGLSNEEAAIQTRIFEQENKRAEKAKEYNTDLETRLAAQENENQNAGHLTKEAYIQKALADEQKKAKQAGVELDAAQIERVKQIAAGEWEVTNQKREQKSEQQGANALLQQANALFQQRNALQTQLQQQLAVGDTTGADATSIKLQQVNMDLQSAIQKAREMWEAIGGPQADVALAKLDTLGVKVQNATKRTNSFGFSGQQMMSWVDSFASGIANAFGAMGDAIAQGENAFKAFGKAVLQTFASILRDIAVTIIKMQILKMLAGMGGGIGGAASGVLQGMGVAVAHSGAVAGSTSRGRTISGAALAGAMVYHTGGVAGLKSDEVMTVLQRGETIRTQAQEEALTERMMLAEKSSSGGAQTIRNVITLDEESASNYLTSSGGEKAIWSVLGKNRAKLRDLAGG